MYYADRLKTIFIFKTTYNSFTSDCMILHKGICCLKPSSLIKKRWMRTQACQLHLLIQFLLGLIKSVSALTGIIWLIMIYGKIMDDQ